MNLSFLKALGDRTRLDIIALLLGGGRTVTDIQHHLKLSQPATSLALKVLLQAGIAERERRGKEIVYSLKERKKMKKILMTLVDD